MRPEDILILYTFNSLRTIARVREYPLSALRRSELISALAERLFDPSELQRMLALLGERERATLIAVVEAGGRLASDELAHFLLEQGVVESVGPARPRETIDRIAPTTRRFDEICARLTAYGLLFSEPKAGGTLAGPHDLSPGQVLFVPGPVFDLVRRLEQAPAAEQPSRPAQDAHQSPAVEPQIRGRLIVQPSYQLLLLPPLDDSSLQRLREFSETVRVAEVAEFKLTQAALFRAVQQGTTVADVIAFLETRSEQPLPQNVHYTLGSWSRVFEQVRVYADAVLVEGAAELLDRLQVDERLAALVIRRLTPQRLLLRNGALVEQTLALLDELPLVTPYTTAHSRLQFSIDADGVLTPHPTADLLLPIRLRRVAEPRADGRFQLTPERVRSAVAATPDGLTGVLKWLRTHGGDLPADLLARLKIWALPKDSVALEQPLLLRLPADLLADLRAIPELGSLLGNEYRPEAAVVQVAPQHRERLLDVLSALDIEVGEERRT
ncbi:MAG: helicase-associated domain-containing protein [Chloroflexi bacterium]|nr:helicase-associated domain-containing protein [Chloroflexota bacterium]